MQQHGRQTIAPAGTLTKEASQYAVTFINDFRLARVVGGIPTTSSRSLR
jgi:hypothetical protein